MRDAWTWCECVTSDVTISVAEHSHESRILETKFLTLLIAMYMASKRLARFIGRHFVAEISGERKNRAYLETCQNIFPTKRKYVLVSSLVQIYVEHSHQNILLVCIYFNVHFFLVYVADWNEFGMDFEGKNVCNWRPWLFFFFAVMIRLGALSSFWGWKNALRWWIVAIFDTRMINWHC